MDGMRCKRNGMLCLIGVLSILTGCTMTAGPENTRPDNQRYAFQVWNKIHTTDYYKTIRQCVQQAGDTRTDLKGTLRLAIEVQEDGTVRRAGFVPEQTTIADPTLLGCVSTAASSWSFAPYTKDHSDKNHIVWYDFCLSKKEEGGALCHERP